MALSERLLQRCRTLNYGEGIRDLVRGPNPIINRSITHGLHPSQRVQSSAKVRFSCKQSPAADKKVGSVPASKGDATSGLSPA